MSGELRFAVDGMLGSLARKLRIFGFDVHYHSDVEDRDLIELAAAEDRIIVTCDRDLADLAAKRGLKSILLDGGDDEERMVVLMKRVGVKAEEFLPVAKRCPLCNGRLKPTLKEEVVTIVPERVAMEHEDFYRCSECGKIYWAGSHWRRIGAFARRVRIRLSQT